ncbi:MAG: hypothetical protein ABI959_08235 [Candidatus Dormiibacterota bacterium]
MSNREGTLGVPSPAPVVVSNMPVVASLEARLTVLRRRRRQQRLKQVVAISPVIIGMWLVLLAAFGGIAGFR